MARKSLVTGAAGFIGSQLVEALLDRGDDVIGIDSFTDYYPRAAKDGNVARALASDRFRLVEEDLNETDLSTVIADRDVVYHLAAQAGVRASWGTEFDTYLFSNVRATQRILETVKEHSGVRVVYASSSSVYGDTRQLPLSEDAPTAPNSPYGATKLAGEHLCQLYHANYGVDVLSLRYFTVYGPRQRPDMAFHRFIRAIMEDRPLDIYGDGSQSRDCTFVGDIVQATLLAGEADPSSRVFNIGGGARRSLLQNLELLQELLGRKAQVRHTPRARGDVSDTHADISRACRELGYEPKVPLEDGLRQEIEWLCGAVADQG
ncbi:MAG: NAD-dependent epimerase/dehydratase family protein [Gemmatimonadota bacterium]|jgi:UDP-glucose 4-epimerase|nr:UDP-glucose 4-epimerase [Gemmatimonadota bacterium]MDP6528122.1 NAD-dependent epimerase/dehydratase family protein [Gemmatimonadota bacterium]MDP6803667.1 NAD-dependent epimerase/dehydratase family protein [Gemmatimonadota bacterium]MDP7031717.1 NAD-dependent epimerase/dehydratase family protein [Gemmatimonadota bacterium]